MKTQFAIALLLCTLQLTALHARVLTQGNMRRLQPHLGVRTVRSDSVKVCLLRLCRDERAANVLVDSMCDSARDSSHTLPLR